MKSDFTVQNNVVNVCCSYLSMVFPYIGNVKYPYGRTYEQQRFKSKRRKIANGEDCVAFHRTLAYHGCHSFFSLEATRSFIPSLMILDHTSFKVRPRTDDKDVPQDSFCFSGFSSGVARIFPEVRPTFLHRLPHPLHPKSQHFFKLPLLKVRLTVVSQSILLFIKCHNL